MMFKMNQMRHVSDYSRMMKATRDANRIARNKRKAAKQAMRLTFERWLAECTYQAGYERAGVLYDHYAAFAGPAHWSMQMWGQRMRKIRPHEIHKFGTLYWEISLKESHERSYDAKESLEHARG